MILRENFQFVLECKRRLQPLPAWRTIEAKAGAFAYGAPKRTEDEDEFEDEYDWGTSNVFNRNRPRVLDFRCCRAALRGSVPLPSPLSQNAN